MCLVTTDTETMRCDLQVILPFERLPAHAAHVFPLVTVRQLVLGQRGCVPEHLSAHLQHTNTKLPLHIRTNMRLRLLAKVPVD
jgi:hypothetical protein